MSENDSYGEYATEADQQIQPADSLDDRGVDDVLDEGYSPPEKWSVLERFGNTAREEREGETLDERLAEEEPDPALRYDDEGVRDYEAGVGDARAGRLVSPDEGAHADTEKDLVADDVGIDGGAASAEEAAVHVVEEE